MMPAQQRLGADYRAVDQPDLGLEIQLEFVLGEGAPQIEIEPAAGLRLRSQHRQEKAIGPSALGFRLIERKIGIRDQLAPSAGPIAMPALPPMCRV